MVVQVDKIEGRNIHLKGTVYDINGGEYAKAESHFVSVPWIMSSHWKDAFDKLRAAE